MQLNKEQVLDLLRSGTSEERIEFLQELPPNGFKDIAAGMVGSENPGMVIVALGSLILEYCYGSNPECGGVLAEAAHERAVEICKTVPDHGLIATTLSGLANSHLKALTLLGRSEEVLEAAEYYIPLYERLNESQNLPALKVLQIDALVNLQRIEEAAIKLQDQSLFQDEYVGIEAKRLKQLVEDIQRNPTDFG